MTNRLPGITNYTSRVSNTQLGGKRLSRSGRLVRYSYSCYVVAEQDIALKFLSEFSFPRRTPTQCSFDAGCIIAHFIGDIGQPLHCEAYEVGGNDIPEKFDGTSTELHAVYGVFLLVN